VDAFHAAGLALGGSDDGPPGPREHDEAGQIYYAAFIRDPDGNRIEVQGPDGSGRSRWE